MRPGVIEGTVVRIFRGIRAVLSLADGGSEKILDVRIRNYVPAVGQKVIVKPSRISGNIAGYRKHSDFAGYDIYAVEEKDDVQTPKYFVHIDNLEELCEV